MKKSFQIVLGLFFLFSLPCFAEDFNITNVAWSSVLDGECVIAPVETSFGFVTYTDGKTLSAFTKKGELIWEKRLSGKGNPFITILEEDFILCTTDNPSRLVLFNSSGIKLWEKEIGFKVAQSPLAGRDGRFFIAGENEAACYTISGIFKWHTYFGEVAKVNKSDPSLPLCELSDGSFVVFLEKNAEGKTTAIRFTPFGEICEDITFAGAIKEVQSGERGIYLVFIDGTAGLFSLNTKTNISENQFVVRGEKFSKSKNKHIVLDKFLFDDAVCVTGEKNGVKVFQFDQRTGLVYKDFLIKDIKFENITNLEVFSNNIFISDSSRAVLYNLNGLEIRNDRLPPQSGRTKWNHAFFTSDGFLLFCKKNWTLDAYRIIQIKTRNAKDKKDYSSWYKVDPSLFNSPWITRFEGELFTNERIKTLIEGGNGWKEKEYSQELKSFIQAYIDDVNSGNSGGRVDKTAFKLDVEHKALALTQLSLFGTNDFADLLAKVLKTETSSTILIAVLKNYKNSGWDPEGKILQVLQTIAENADPRNEAVLLELCECTVSVCRFMGRPAFNQNGKVILSKMLYPKYGIKVNSKARDCLKEIAGLKM